jgi:hypothetical protein
MAKDSHNLAGSFDTEEAGGLLTGFLAEEDPFDRRSLWRLGSWGVGAVGAVVVAVLANQSSIGWRREQIASVDLARQSQQIQSIAKEGQNETRRLASAVETLNGDRDRLYSRITVLEQGLDSVTGSIARQNAGAASPQASPQPSSPQPSPVASSSPVSSPTSSSTLSSAPAASSTTAFVGPPSPAMSTSPAKADPPVTQTAAPAVAPVATAAPAKAATPPDKQPSVAATSESAPAAVTSAGQTASSAPAATPATPLMPAKSIMGPPDPAAGKPAGSDAPPDAVAAAAAPVVVAAAAAADDARADAAPAAATVQRTEFAVDIGTANSVGGLRALWRGLLKSKANSALAALHPIIMVKEGNTGLGMQLRLAAGPLSDAAAAAKICAALIEGKRTTCETTVFDGQQLAMKDDEPAASAKPAAVRPASHRRTIAKPRVMVEEPPKPQPTALSSFFGR